MDGIRVSLVRHPGSQDRVERRGETSCKAQVEKVQYI